jgi:hypothetical protein
MMMRPWTSPWLCLARGVTMAVAVTVAVSRG